LWQLWQKPKRACVVIQAHFAHLINYVYQHSIGQSKSHGHIQFQEAGSTIYLLSGWLGLGYENSWRDGFVTFRRHLEVNKPGDYILRSSLYICEYCIRGLLVW
jgi:hypothetical protein